jgi:hypothetical protein
MDYIQACNGIETGDVIEIKGTKGFLTPLTKYFTSSEYTHVGIAYWMDKRLWLVEINGGKNHIIPFTQLADEAFDVYENPGLDVRRIEESIEQSLRNKIDYGYLALPVVGLLNYLKIKIFIHARKILECAGFSVMILEGAGWPEHTRILSPQDLADLLKFKFSYQPPLI